MPGYGISTSSGPDELLSWSWAAQRLESARNYWICTARPDGRPHAMPVWGVVLDGRVMFSTGRGSRKARNLAADPAVVVHLESGDEVVILEGVVTEETSAGHLATFCDAYEEKYALRPDPDADDAVTFRVEPEVAFGWLEADYPNTATRWSFHARQG